jgi:RNA polymerase sigma-70 factor, ECF subfamily
MEIQASRAAARVSPDGEMVLLLAQDRSLWDRARIDRGLSHLARAAGLPWPGAYVAEAQIAACHARAATPDDTDWRAIKAAYASLADIAPSPVVELNRAVAVSMVDGPLAALAIVDALAKNGALGDYHLLPAVRADFLRRLGRQADAAAEYRRAIALTANEKEREFLRRRVAECEPIPKATS